MKHKTIITALSLGLIASTLRAIPVSVEASVIEQPRLISVTVQEEKSFQLDQIILVLSVQKKEKNFELASKAVLNSLKACVDMIKDQGINEKNIVYQKFVHSPESRWFGDVIVAQSGVTIKLNQGQSITPILKSIAAVDKEIQIKSVQYSFSNPSEIDKQMVQALSERVKSKKESLESSLGVKLRVSKIQEERYPQNFAMQARLYKVASEAVMASEEVQLPTPEEKRMGVWAVDYEIISK